MSVRFSFRDFERQARRMGAFADQIPFALSQSLNDAAEATRKQLAAETWAKYVEVRNRNFMRAALTIAGNRATKKRLRVAIVDKLGRGSLLQHARGGEKNKIGKNIAIPSRIVKPQRTSKGVPSRLRPRALPNSFVRGDEIFQRVGAEGEHLKLMFTLKPRVRIRRDVPFDAEFERSMRREVPKAFKRRLRAAMATRKG